MMWLQAWPPWLSHLLIGFYIVGLMGFGAFVLVRAGRSPLWVVLMLVPTVQVIALYVFAFIRWPRVDGPGDETDT